MCPGTLAIISTAITAGSAVLGGVTQAEAAHYQGQVAKNNAVIATSNARYSASAGAANAEQASLRAGQRLAGLRASQGALGVDANTGSAADVQVGQREVGSLDSATVSNNTALEVYGYKNKATAFLAQAKQDNQEAGLDVVGGIVEGAGKFLSNPTANQAISGAFTRNSISSGVNSADSWTSSLLSSAPSVTDQYGWMRDDDINGATYAAQGFG